jgi:hypothetical protein
MEQAGIAVGVPPEKTAQAFLNFPAVAWDAGVAPAVAADTQWAVRDVYRRAGIESEQADAILAKVAVGLKAVATIPNVVGQQEALATANLIAAGVRVGTKTYSTNAAPALQVLTQVPAAGASEVGKPVNLTISLGP